MSESLSSLTKNQRCERMAQVAHQKWVNEQIACFFLRIAHSLIICSFFSKKTSDSLRKPMSKFPAMNKSKFFKWKYIEFILKLMCSDILDLIKMQRAFLNFKTLDIFFWCCMVGTYIRQFRRVILKILIYVCYKPTVTVLSK